MRAVHRVARPYDDDRSVSPSKPPREYAPVRPVERGGRTRAPHSTSRTAAPHHHRGSGEANHMELRVERDALVDAVGWTARSLPTRPPMQVLLGLLLETAADGLSV